METTDLEKYEVTDYIRNKLEGRRVAVWGTGNLSVLGDNFLKYMQIQDYCYIDSSEEKQKQTFRGREVLSPFAVTKEYYLVISTTAFPEIAVDLYKRGFRDLEDYMYICDLNYYEALLKWNGIPGVPEVTEEMMRTLERELIKCVPCKGFVWPGEDKFASFVKETDFLEKYKKGYETLFETVPGVRYRRKMQEYYITDQLLDFAHWKKGDVYADLGAQTSPFVKYLREKRGIEAYGLDIEESIYKDLGYYLQEDITDTHFDDNSVRGMSCHSAYETFTGDVDSRLIREAARILKPGGKLIIVPLYMHEQYLSTTSPTYYQQGFADEGSFECIRTDCRGKLAIGRFYDVKALKKRVLEVAEEVGLQAKIYIFPDNLVECDAFVYLKFILELKK